MTASNPAARPYAEVIGDPISHSKSPMIHGFWLTRLGIDAEYRACHVRSSELADFLARRRDDADWRGCNVTVPHKEAIARLIDQCDAKASAIGAVNTIVRHSDGRLHGSNTDIDGVADAVGALPLAGRVAVVIGSGGAARSALAFLAAQDCAAVRILARSSEKARKAAADCGVDADILPFSSGSHALAGASLVINATQLGMVNQQEMPAFVLDELASLAGDALVFDMVYAPLATDLLKAAKARGARTADGLLMLVGQAAVAFERLFGRTPPREHDAELRALLTS
jgi:shikimate dehydrogenase